MATLIFRRTRSYLEFSCFIQQDLQNFAFPVLSLSCKARRSAAFAEELLFMLCVYVVLYRVGEDAFSIMTNGGVNPLTTGRIR